MAISRRLRFEILRRDNNTCRYCGASAPDAKLTIDHVVPQSLGGADEPSNLVTACQDCNAGKSSSSPDAVLVAEVSEDTLRWAAAQREAAARLAATFTERDELRNRFQDAWNGYTVQGRPIELPLGWRDSVDSILAAGLPIELLIDAIHIAMGKESVKNSNLFRYMCGVAWRRIEKINADARTAISSAPRSAAQPAHASVAELLLEDIAQYIGFVPIDNPLEYDDALRCADDFVYEHDIALPTEYALLFCMIKGLISEGEVMAESAHRLLHLYDKEDIRQIWHKVRREFEENGFEHPTEVDYMHNITLHLERRTATERQPPPAADAGPHETALEAALGGVTA